MKYTLHGFGHAAVLAVFLGFVIPLHTALAQGSPTPAQLLELIRSQQR